MIPTGKNSQKVAIAGAGLGGLSCALILASRGFEVEVFDKLDGPGGKAAEKKIDGYRFDMGPSLLTLPGVFEELFDQADERLDDHLQFERLDPITRYFFDDGTVLDAWSDKKRFAAEVEEKLGEPAQNVIRYLERCRKTYEASTPLFMYKPLHEKSTLATIDTFKAFINTPKADAFRTMHSVNSRWFKDDRTVQLFDRYATYNGSSPYMTPATFNLIQHVEYGIGGYAVKGGIHRIPAAIESVCREKGVRFHYNTEVERIVVEQGKVRGLVAEGKFENAGVVVSNTDVTGTYSKLLCDSSSGNARRYNNLEPSSSGQVFLWGIRKHPDDLLVNNIFFSSDYGKEFDDIWKSSKSPVDPTVYVNITSKVDDDDAPHGSENWFVLVNVPYDSGQDWKLEKERTKKAILGRLKSVTGDDLTDSIEVEYTMGPVEIEHRYSGNKGSIYGISSNKRASAFLRQPNRSRTYKGLFFAGGSAHPGGGMPLVTLSGKHAADLITKKYRQ